jgi:hypothetical protein
LSLIKEITQSLFVLFAKTTICQPLNVKMQVNSVFFVWFNINNLSRLVLFGLGLNLLLLFGRLDVFLP